MLAFVTVSVVFVSACASGEDTATVASVPAANLAGEGVTLTMEGESHFQNLRQLTAGGENAEAYWAFDGSQLIYRPRSLARSVTRSSYWIRTPPRPAW